MKYIFASSTSINSVALCVCFLVLGKLCCVYEMFGILLKANLMCTRKEEEEEENDINECYTGNTR